jgi:hypothetical protein
MAKEEQTMATTDETRVLDADAHMTERHDLFTERAPKGYEDRVPQVKHIDGANWWTVDGQRVSALRSDSQGKVLGENGIKLYRLS